MKRISILSVCLMIAMCSWVFVSSVNAAQLSTGWCCADGNVYKSTEKNCKAKNGVFLSNEKKARAVCEALEKGWCCADGKVFQATKSECMKNKGSFYDDKKQANKACEALKKGWCCAEDKIQQLTKKECEQKEGKYFSKKLDANRFFRSVEKKKKAHVKAKAEPYISIAKVFQKDGKVHILVKNKGRGRLSAKDYKQGEVVLSYGGSTRTWSLKKVDPKGLLGKFGGEVEFDTGISLKKKERISVKVDNVKAEKFKPVRIGPVKKAHVKAKAMMAKAPTSKITESLKKPSPLKSKQKKDSAMITETMMRLNTDVRAERDSAARAICGPEYTQLTRSSIIRDSQVEVRSLTPRNGIIGQTLVIQGTGFGNEQGHVSIAITDPENRIALYGNIRAWTNNHIELTIPLDFESYVEFTRDGSDEGTRPISEVIQGTERVAVVGDTNLNGDEETLLGIWPAGDDPGFLGNFTITLDPDRFIPSISSLSNNEVSPGQLLVITGNNLAPAGIPPVVTFIFGHHLINWLYLEEEAADNHISVSLPWALGGEILVETPGRVEVRTALGHTALRPITFIPEELPEGSYRDTCVRINFMYDNLTARCRKPGGGSIRSTLRNVSECISGVCNNNGYLDCERR